MTADTYQQHMNGVKDTINKTVNALKSEWGDAYGSKVELGQMVIAKFAGTKEANDFLTSTLAKSPEGIKFLAKIGEQFAENSVGDFKHSSYSMTPAEAENEYNKIMSNPNHPYLNEKAGETEHQIAVDYVNKLIATIGKGKQQGQA
jgi:hypothetical protein